MVDETEDCRACDEESAKEIQILDTALNMASAVVINGDSIEYLQLSYIGGEYTIVHSLRNYYITDILDTKEISQNTEPMIFPNPVNDMLNVQFSGESYLSYKVIDLKGVVLKSGSISSQSTQIDVRGIPEGLYVVQFIDDEKPVFTTRFVMR
jgi:hypothetical protein